MPSMLILGGTHFVGYAVAEAAAAVGWNVTVLHRGHSPSPVGASETLIGDRTNPDHVRLFDGRGWDAVVDTWSGETRVVETSTSALHGHVDRYVYISSQSVYVWPSPAGANEHAPLVPTDPINARSDYASFKRTAEDAVLKSFDERCLIARAGLLLGPRELPSRLPWWLDRISRGGDVPVPGVPDFDIQYLDVRDLAEWILQCLQRDVTGIFNAIGPIGGTTIGEVVSLCREITGSNASWKWIDSAIIEREGIRPWTSLPLWITPGAEHGAVYRRDVTAAHDSGLAERPLRDTVAAAWDWTCSPEGRSALSTANVGLTPEEEERLLAHI